jgi:hypothetical protein
VFLFLRLTTRLVQSRVFEFFSVKPRRLAKRHFKNNPLFALKIFGQLCGLKKYPMG